MNPDPEKEIAINVQLLDRAVSAAEHLSPGLKFVVLPTGTKVAKPLKLPIQTDMVRHTAFIFLMDFHSHLRSKNHSIESQSHMHQRCFIITR